MLHEIGLRNFKAFGSTMQRAPLSKINLIYGPNSGGKSSIIQALLLLKQSQIDDRFAQMAADEPSGKLRPRGEYVDLGSYGALIHRHDTSQLLGISLSYEGQGLSRNRAYGRLVNAQSVTSDMSFFGPRLNYATDFAGMHYAVAHDGRTLFDGQWTDTVDDRGRRKIDSNLSIGTTKIPSELVRISTNSFLPYIYVPGLTPEGGVNWEQANSNPAFVEMASQIEGELGVELFNVLRSTHAIRSYENLLHSIIYLGPLRSNPERIYTVQRMDRTSTGVRGEFTHELLSANAGFVQQANQWFDRFDIPYEMTVDNFGVVNVTGEYISIGLVDQRTDTKVTLADVGFGINQVLPVIVEALTPAAGRSFFSPTHSIICVEQPEIHLHPKLQAVVADLAIETSKGPRGKQWIIETHSELLMRRIQRRIAERVIDQRDVSVIYVHPQDSTGSQILPLGLDNYGEFVDDWPEGFFEEGYDEIMAY